MRYNICDLNIESIETLIDAIRINKIGYFLIKE